jgi:uncharacterized protein (DUF58 family)
MYKLKVNLKPMLKKLESTSKRGLFGELTGEYRSAFKGKGFEFTGFRKYQPSDDASAIDWKTSLRTHDLVIRQYIEERNLEILFVFDVSSSMSFASQDKLKNEYAAELIASLTYSMLELGDAVGILMFTDKIVKLINPDIGARQFYKITKALSDPSLYDGSKDIEKIFRFIAGSIKQTTILILVSDFIGFNKGWDAQFRLIAERSEVIGMMIRDPYDIIMPNIGQVAISDPFSDREVLLDTGRYRAGYELETKKQIQELRRIFTETRSDLVILVTNKSFVQPMINFMRMRRARCR